MSSCRKVFPKTRREVMLALYLKDSSTLLSVSFVVFSFIFRLILIVVSYKSRLLYTPLVYATVQILQANSVRKCPECKQPLPESYSPPADEPWTTGIFGCTEDRESCK
ncbi:hypothetical protein S245_070007 [Arachis hypogaea]